MFHRLSLTDRVADGSDFTVIRLRVFECQQVLRPQQPAGGQRFRLPAADSGHAARFVPGGITETSSQRHPEAQQ